MGERLKLIALAVVGYVSGTILSHWLWGVTWPNVSQRIYFGCFGMLWMAWMLRKYAAPKQKERA